MWFNCTLSLNQDEKEYEAAYRIVGGFFLWITKFKNSDFIKNINSEIEENILLIDYLEKVEKIMSSIGFDIRNIIEIQKLETQ